MEDKLQYAQVKNPPKLKHPVKYTGRMLQVGTKIMSPLHGTNYSKIFCSLVLREALLDDSMPGKFYFWLIS